MCACIEEESGQGYDFKEEGEEDGTSFFWQQELLGERKVRIYRIFLLLLWERVGISECFVM